jgi:MFS family permease
MIALFSWGLGFYGPSVYLAALQRLHGWSATTIATPVTVYYLAGALLVSRLGAAIERFGPRAVVRLGALALAASVTALGVIDRPWQLYPVFILMAVGWAAMSGAAVNTLVAPWFVRRRGLAISLAFNGASLGGVIIAPVLIALIGALGFRAGVAVAAAGMLVIMLPLTVLLHRGPDALGLGPDGDPPTSRAAAPVIAGARGAAVRTARFWSVSGPFALALTAQVGLITHLVAFLAPRLGTDGAARAVSLATIAAIVGRLGTGLFVDRVNPRLATTLTLVVQITGVACLAATASSTGLYAGALLFGLGVGNLVSLPSLILAAEWPRERFASLISLVVALNQFTFAFGPALIGIVRDWSGDYGPALIGCAVLQAVAAVWVLFGDYNWRMKHRHGLAVILVVALAAGCATTPTAQGRDALRSGRPAEAAEHFQTALSEDPGKIDALVGLGISHYRLGAYDEAIATLNDALAKGPNLPAARLYLALSGIRKHDDAKAREQLEALHALPSDPRFNALVGQALDLLRAGPLADPQRTYLVASLDYGAEWSRELAETRMALRNAELAWDPFWARPTYVIRCRNC